MIRTADLTLTVASEGDLYLADFPDNPANIRRTSVIVRTVGEKASVRAVYTSEKA